ncbi:hypothetical protein [Nonomuraea typhae]|uniref:hypothetical protein n=1 Tax=Nonomuraea typhae TaxID=2603600 RepID=UPI0012F79259|nr:hypothetical protein [Nonomuraea typhae]
MLSSTPLAAELAAWLIAFNVVILGAGMALELIQSGFGPQSEVPVPVQECAQCSGEGGRWLRVDDRRSAVGPAIWAPCFACFTPRSGIRARAPRMRRPGRHESPPSKWVA